MPIATLLAASAAVHLHGHGRSNVALVTQPLNLHLVNETSSGLPVNVSSSGLPSLAPTCSGRRSSTLVVEDQWFAGLSDRAAVLMGAAYLAEALCAELEAPRPCELLAPDAATTYPDAEYDCAGGGGAANWSNLFQIVRDGRHEVPVHRATTLCNAFACESVLAPDESRVLLGERQPLGWDDDRPATLAEDFRAALALALAGRSFRWRMNTYWWRPDLKEQHERLLRSSTLKGVVERLVVRPSADAEAAANATLAALNVSSGSYVTLHLRMRTDEGLASCPRSPDEISAHVSRALRTWRRDSAATNSCQLDTCGVGTLLLFTDETDQAQRAATLRAIERENGGLAAVDADTAVAAAVRRTGGVLRDFGGLVRARTVATHANDSQMALSVLNADWASWRGGGAQVYATTLLCRERAALQLHMDRSLCETTEPPRPGLRFHDALLGTYETREVCLRRGGPLCRDAVVSLAGYVSIPLVRY